MRAADQWAHIEETLDPGWSEVRLAFTPEGSLSEAAAVLGALQPVRVGDEFRFHVTRSEGGAERTRNTMRRLDQKRVWGASGIDRRGRNVTGSCTGERSPSTRDGACSRRRVGRGPLDASVRLERPSVRARARVERPPSARRASRRTAQPVACSRRPRSPLPRVGQAGLRGFAADGTTLLRAHGRGRHHRPDHDPERSLGHRERRHAGAGVACRRPFRVAHLRDDLRCREHGEARRSSRANAGDRSCYARNSASKRSASTATMRLRTSVASSSVSVRSGDWKARWIATDLRPAPTWSPR